MNRNSRKKRRRVHSPVVDGTTSMANNNNTIIVDLSDAEDGPESTELLEVIDLTVESPQLSTEIPSPVIVDLTQCSSSSAHRFSTRRQRSNRKGRQRENRPPLMQYAISFISDDSDSELEMLPIINSPPTLTERTEPLNTSADDPLSPRRKEISCPICMETERQIMRRRQLVSTVCGHIFCSTCITDSIKSQHKCPACRKKLTLKQFHPIFL